MDQYGLAIRRQRGIDLDELSGDQVREMEPALGPIVRRGVYAPNAGHIVNPHRLVTTLAALLREKGIEPDPAGKRMHDRVCRRWQTGRADRSELP